jgi:hypothetical protein
MGSMLQTWPSGLRTTVSLCLSSNFPINIVWGLSYTQIYNDGYRVIVSDRHPDGMAWLTTNAGPPPGMP